MDEKGYTLPEYAFTVECDEVESEESGQLDVKDEIVLTVKNFDELKGKTLKLVWKDGSSKMEAIRMKNLNNLKFVLYSFFILFNNLYLFAQNKLYKQTVKIECSDQDLDKAIIEPVLNIEVFQSNKLIQTINYTYNDTFMLIKHFDFTDINFDGYNDIVILAGLTANRGQPYYEVYLWYPKKNQFIHTSEISDSMPNLYIDAEKKLLYSFYMMNDGRNEYHIFKFEDDHFIEKDCLQEFVYIFDYPVYLYENENFGKNCNFKTVQELSDVWKRVISLSNFSYDYSNLEKRLK